MKKSIFLFFAAILCAMTANAQWYLRGSFNDWGTRHQFVNNICEIELPAGTSYEFKVADANWKTGYGYPEITSTSTKTQNGGSNTKFKTGLPGIYKFEISSDAKKLTVTYPELPAPHDITVRAKVPAHWTNDIYAHVWTSENASGSDVGPLTKEGDYYVVTKNAGALYVIFKNGSAWSDKNQTVDLCYTEDVCLQLNQSGSAKATATVIDCGAVSKDITVKAVVPEAWENTITAWVWPTGGEGKEVTPTKDGNWYVVTENCIELNVIFKNGTGWNGNENQTANITGVSENTCYQISALNKDGEGKCTYTVVDCEAAIEPEAKPVDVYTVVGADVLLGTAWDLNNTDNDMTKQGDGSYVLVKENVELATTGTYEYKVVKNRSWDWKGVNEGNNLTLTGVDVDGTYNVTFTLNKELNALTASLELVEAKKVIPECYVAGDESLTGQDWNAKSVVMTYDEATEVYTATLTAVPAGTHNMKVVYGGEWLGFDHLATPAPANVKEGDDKKIQFTLAEAGDVTITYHVTNGINLTGNFALPVTYDYYIAGTLAGGWSATQQGMTKDGDVYKATFTELNAGEYEFKITAGDWEHQWNYSNLGAAYEEVSQGVDEEGNPNGNIKIVTEEAKNITVIFDATAGKITLEGLTEKVVVISYVLMGVGSDWTTGIALTKNETAEYEEYVLLGQEIAEGDAVKVVTLTNGGATAWCGNVDEYSVAHTFDDNGNIVLAPGKYDFYFKVNDDIIYIGGEAYPVEPEYDMEITCTNLKTVSEGNMTHFLGTSADGMEIDLIVFGFNGAGTYEGVEGSIYADGPISFTGTAEYAASAVEGTETNVLTADLALANGMTVKLTMYNLNAGDTDEPSTPGETITVEMYDATFTVEDGELAVEAENDDHAIVLWLSEWNGYGDYEANSVWGYVDDVDVANLNEGASVEKEGLVATLYVVLTDGTNTYNVIVSGMAPAEAGDDDEPVEPNETITITANNLTASVPYAGYLLLKANANDADNTQIFLWLVDGDTKGYDEYGYTEYPSGLWPDVENASYGDVNLTLSEDVVAKYYQDGTIDKFEGTFLGDDNNLYILVLCSEAPATALDNVDTTVAPAKAIVNGQLVIIKNGVQYNAQGAVVK